jgi:hypothetical protein
MALSIPQRVTARLQLSDFMAFDRGSTGCQRIQIFEKPKVSRNRVLTCSLMYSWALQAIHITIRFVDS